MDTDFSWRRAANDYMDIYHELHPEIIRYNEERLAVESTSRHLGA